MFGQYSSADCCAAANEPGMNETADAGQLIQALLCLNPSDVFY